MAYRGVELMPCDMRRARRALGERAEFVLGDIRTADFGKSDAVVRESADLLYNLTVLWASAGVRPEDVWREMERREHLLGIAEKLPKSAVKMPKTIPPKVARRPIVALEVRARKRH